MKRYILLGIILLLSGCKTPVHTTTNTNNVKRLETIGAIATVQKEYLAANDIDFSTRLNTNILTLAESPTPKEIAEVKESISDSKNLNKRIDSLVQEKRTIAKEKDDALINLQSENKDLKEKYEELSNPFHAIWFGVKTLFKRFLLTISAIGIIYVLIRMFASTNPLAATALSFLEQIGAYVCNVLLPNIGKHTSKGSTTDETAEILVDVIASLNDNNTIADLKNELAKDCDASHRAEIYRIKQRLGWK